MMASCSGPHTPQRDPAGSVQEPTQGAVAERVQGAAHLPPGGEALATDDGSPCRGDEVRPGEDVQRALDGAHAGTVCLADGTFRIRTSLQLHAGQTLWGTGRSVLSGSVTLSGWRRSGAGWVAKAPLPRHPDRTGRCEDQTHNLCQLSQQVFVDDVWQRRVASVEGLGPGAFHADYDQGVVHLGTDPRHHAVEMSLASRAVSAAEPGATVRGLVVEHFANPAQQGAVLVGPQASVFDNEVRWNHGVGIGLRDGDGARVYRNRVHHNGQLGMSQYRSRDAVIVQNVIEENNTDGFWVADWESGGLKVTRSSGLVSGNTVRNNLGVGVWCDIAVEDMTIRDNTITDNGADGIRYEISRRATIADNRVVGNGAGMRRGGGTTLWSTAGINLNTAEDVRITGNSLSGNVNGISVQARHRGGGPWGTYRSGRVLVQGNTVVMDRGGARTGVVAEADAPTSGAVSFRRNSYVVDRLSALRWTWYDQDLDARSWRASHEQSMGVTAS